MCIYIFYSYDANQPRDGKEKAIHISIGNHGLGTTVLCHD